MFSAFELAQLVPNKNKKFPITDHSENIIKFMGERSWRPKEIALGTGIANTTVRGWLTKNAIRENAKGITYWSLR